MNVSIIIPAQGSEAASLGLTLEGVRAQRYDAGRIEVFVVEYGGHGAVTLRAISSSHDIQFLSVDHPGPYNARNLAANKASGDMLVFTEPGCVPDADWIQSHAAAMHDSAITISVGRILGGHSTRHAEVFMSYEDVRDAWVFSCDRWQHYFGRPKNMAVARRRFETHGPFEEVLRGADSTLVQSVARDISCREIAFTPDAVVRQASVHGLTGLLAERFRHARAMRIHKSSHAAPIALDQRIELFHQTIRQRNYTRADAVALWALLGTGILAFRLGGIAGAIHGITHPSQTKTPVKP